MTREQHLKWCKDRAMEYVRAGDFDQAFASMMSDLSKHDDTRPSVQIGFMLGSVEVSNAKKNGAHAGKEIMRRFIEGFN